MNRKLGFCCCGWWGGVTEVMLSRFADHATGGPAPGLKSCFPANPLCPASARLLLSSPSGASPSGKDQRGAGLFVAGRWGAGLPGADPSEPDPSAAETPLGAGLPESRLPAAGQAARQVVLRCGRPFLRLLSAWRRWAAPQHLCVHGGAVFLCGMRERVWRGSGGQGRPAPSRARKSPPLRRGNLRKAANRSMGTLRS